MTKTVARHRAPLSARAWVARTWLAVSALPVGALAGCTTVAVAASVDRPQLGLLGLGAVIVPLSIATWRARLVDVDPAHGRRALGRPVVLAEVPAADAPAPSDVALPDALVLPVAAEAGRLPIVLDMPDLTSLQRAAGHTGPADLPSGAVPEDAPSRLFTVAAGGSEVEVVVLTREERAARDLAVLEQLDTAVVEAAPAPERLAA